MPMDRRQFVRKVAAAGVGVLVGRAVWRAEGAQQPPNFLFIMTDQHRIDAMGAYGNRAIQTPHLDALAAASVRFQRYYIAAFPCSPSRATVITGLHPQSHGVVTNGVKLREDIPTFATELAAAGYKTTWMGKWHLGGPWGFVPAEPGGLPRVVRMKSAPPGERMPQNGFQDGVSPTRDYIAYLRELGLEEPRPGKKVRGGHHTVIEDGHSVIPQEHCVEAFITDRAIEYLNTQARSGRPFCLCVSYPGPHRPMTPPEPWDRMYDPDKLPLPPTVNDPMKKAPRTHREFRWRMYGIDLQRERERLKRGIVFENEMWDVLDRPAWTAREYRELMAHYYGYISYIDHQIGRLLSVVDKLGLSENTVVIYTTDHGEFMGGHGCIFKGMMMYDDLMRVPLLVRLPGQRPAPRVTNVLASSVDIMPTILDVAGLPVPEGVHGKSLRPVLEGRADTHHEAVFTSFATAGIQMRMVRTSDYKYSLNWRPRQRNELYDMNADPLEMSNLAGEPQVRSVEDQLRRRLYRFMRQTKDPWRHQARLAADAQPLKRILFEFDDEREIVYWAFYRGLSGVRIRDGKLVGRIDCPGYMVARLDEPVRGDDYPVLEVCMATTAGSAAQFYWATRDRPQMCEAMSIRFPIVSDGKMHRYRLSMADNALWRGHLITHIRLNPVRRSGGQDRLVGNFEIDRIGPPAGDSE